MVTIRATSSDGSFMDHSFLINVVDVDEYAAAPISDLCPAPNAVAENSAAGTVVSYQASSFDADATTNQIVYSLDDNAGGRFAIDSVTGVVTVADGSGLNYEANTSHRIVVRAAGEDGSFSVVSVGISVLDVEERPVGVADHYSTSYIDILHVLGLGVLANDSDPDGDILSFQLLRGTPNGVLAWSSDGKFDYTPQIGFIGQVSFVYQAFDGTLASDPITVTIDVSLPSNIGGSGGGGSGGGGSGGGGSGSGGSGSGGSGTGGSGNGGSGNGGSGNGTGGSSTGSSSATGIQSVTAPSVVANNPVILVSSSDKGGVGGTQDTDSGHGKGSDGFGIAVARESRRIGELNAALSQRVTRLYVDQWMAHRDHDEQEVLRKRDEFVLPGANLLEDNRACDGDDRSAIAINMGTIVTTVLGTGVVFWVVQASQLAATLITAAAPTRIHVDIASTLENLAKEKNACDEASAKIFERTVK